MHSPIQTASAWIKRFASLIPNGEVLDLACGHGRHTRLLLEMGHTVLALDRDEAALEVVTQIAVDKTASSPLLQILQYDLENGAPWPFERERFSGIVVTNYLHRPLFPHIFSSLAPQGVLLYETFCAGNELFGKPSNPDFLLQPAELFAMAGQHLPDGHVIAFEDGFQELPTPSMVQRLCVRRLRPGFSADLAARTLHLKTGESAP